MVFEYNPQYNMKWTGTKWTFQEVQIYQLSYFWDVWLQETDGYHANLLIVAAVEKEHSNLNSILGVKLILTNFQWFITDKIEEYVTYTWMITFIWAKFKWKDLRNLLFQSWYDNSSNSYTQWKMRRNSKIITRRSKVPK